MKLPRYLLPPGVCALAIAVAVGGKAAGNAPLEEGVPAEQLREFARTTSIRTAVAVGDLERVTGLLEADPEWVTSRDLDGNTLLHRAAAAGNAAMVELLLERGADPGAWNAAFELPLELAEVNGHGSLARHLREVLAVRHQQALDRRLSVLILPFHNLSGDSAQAHWSRSWSSTLSTALGEVSRLRVRGESAVGVGLRALKVEPGEAITREQACEVGQRVEVRRVICGEYRFTNEVWAVTARVVHVASGDELMSATVPGTDWYVIRDALVGHILTGLEIEPTDAEWKLLRERGTTSRAALTALSRAEGLMHDRRPMSEVESALREALAADPQWVSGRLNLAMALVNMGRWAEAEAMIGEDAQRESDRWAAHTLRGFIQLRLGREAEAEAEWRSALRLNPEASESLYWWGVLLASRNRPETVVHYFATAVRMNPTDASLRAALAKALVGAGDRDGARAELARAELLDPDDVNAAQTIAEVYAVMDEFSQAITHFDRFFALAVVRGIHPELVQKLADGVDELRKRVIATPVRAVLPREYTPEELAAALAARLTPEERRFVADPLEVTPAMRAWAEEVVRDAADDRARAQALFRAVCQRASGQQGWQGRAASDVFVSTHGGPEALSCNEQGKLWTALARAAGLRAFLVHVECDPDHRVRYHDCAIVFLSGEAFLVDPAYGWFGVPHRQFVVLDDLQAIAHQLLGGVNPGAADACERLRAGVKLHPDLPWAQLNLARGLVLAQCYVEAEEAVRAAERLQSGRWDVPIVRGFLEAHRQRWDAAEGHLREGLRRNPDDGFGQYCLGEVLIERGEFAEAREAYRASLRGLLPPTAQRMARLRLAELNERLSGENAASPQPQGAAGGGVGTVERFP
ncbi:MAG: tetratricopeptide repeat protein [Verrucomicrobia bacterium]|nr:tetratricopeptide repeat protein [Verrucomicrobiota bacterium]